MANRNNNDEDGPNNGGFTELQLILIFSGIAFLFLLAFFS